MSRIKIYPSTEGGYSVSENGVWVNGIFDTEETARAAVKYTNHHLSQLDDVWSIYGENRPATMDDLNRIDL